MTLTMADTETQISYEDLASIEDEFDEVDIKISMRRLFTALTEPR